MATDVIPVSRDRGVLAPRPGIEVTPTAWLSDTDIGMGEWAEHGRRLGVIGRGAGWWIGDWLRYGNERFGERYVRASRITGYDVQTLMNMVYVASRFEAHERREGLSWSHHAEVAAHPVEDRTRWLDMAESERLSVRCLREELRRARRVEANEPEEEPTPQIECPECGCRFSKGRNPAAPIAA